MDTQTKQQLLAAGIDVDAALARFMNNAALMEKFLRRFPADPNYAQLCQALERGDADAAFTAAHTLKGVAGNLSLEHLFAAASVIVESLRSQQLAQARQQLPQLRDAYTRVVDALSSWQ